MQKTKIKKQIKTIINTAEKKKILTLKFSSAPKTLTEKFINKITLNSILNNIDTKFPILSDKFASTSDFLAHKTNQTNQLVVINNIIFNSTVLLNKHTLNEKAIILKLNKMLNTAVLLKNLINIKKV